MLIKTKAFIYMDIGHLSPFHYRHIKVDFLQDESDRQQKEALLMVMVYPDKCNYLTLIRMEHHLIIN